MVNLHTFWCGPIEYFECYESMNVCKLLFTGSHRIEANKNLYVGQVHPHSREINIYLLAVKLLELILLYQNIL